MPIVRIEMWEGRSDAVKEELIRKVSKAVSETVGAPIEHIQVVIFDVPKKHWGIGGVPSTKLD
ncbi:MAG: 2-hydroxymuconate tautomerase [Candidatus Hydrothermarchaeaceae archaeon]